MNRPTTWLPWRGCLRWNLSTSGVSCATSSTQRVQTKGPDVEERNYRHRKVHERGISLQITGEQNKDWYRVARCASPLCYLLRVVELDFLCSTANFKIHFTKTSIKSPSFKPICSMPIHSHFQFVLSHFTCPSLSLFFSEVAIFAQHVSDIYTLICLQLRARVTAESAINPWPEKIKIA